MSNSPLPEPDPEPEPEPPPDPDPPPLLSPLPPPLLGLAMTTWRYVWLDSSAARRSSWLRRAFSTSHTSLNLSFLSSCSSALASIGTTMGMMTYPNFLPSNRRITRPTLWMSVMGELLAARKTMESSAGTSTPSLRQLTLQTMWVSPFLGLRSMVRLRLRSLVSISPDTWLASVCAIRLM